MACVYEQQTIEFAKKEELKITKPIRLIELFGGIGSQAMGLRDIGADFEHYRLVEFDKYAIASYNAIHGTNFVPMDITKITADDLGIVDTDQYCYLMTYSFPCQDISVAGLGKSLEKGSGTRSGLLWEVERLLNELGDNLPQVLLMENVKNLLSSKHKEHFDKWCEYLESKGYSNYYQVMNAKDYGVAQNRERVFMVSCLGGYSYKFPDKIPLTKVMKDYLEGEVDRKYYITTEKAQTLIEKLILNNSILGKKEKVDCVGYIKNHETMEMHQSNVIYNSNGINPCLNANGLTKKTQKVVDCKILENIEKFGNKNSNYCPFDGAVSYPLHSQDFVRTVFMNVCPTLSARDYKDPKNIININPITE